MDNQLLIENINFSYGKNKVLNNISFSCSNGIASILGANGAGKTTLMRVLIGANKPSTGKILLNNENLLECSNNMIGYLPQNFDIYDNITGYDFLSYVCDIKNVSSKEKKQHIDKVIQQFNLESIISKTIRNYSGGCKRRLGIAQAVIGNPNIIIIDEPTVGLDPEQRLEFRHYLSEIGKERIVLISTHILEDVELYTNTILIINQGSIIFKGSTSDAIAQAKNNIYTMNVNIDELALINKKAMVIEEKRLENNMIKIKFIQTDDIVDKSELEKEVSLENAYVFLQKCETSLQ